MTRSVIEVCEKCGTKICVIPFYNDVIPTRPTIDMVGEIKLIQLRIHAVGPSAERLCEAHL